MAQSEYVSYEDESGRTHGVVPRWKAEELNLTTPNVVIFVLAAPAVVWIHRRSTSKRQFPGLWDVSACGGIVSGESPTAAATRELWEEMGLKCDLRHVTTFLNTFSDGCQNLNRRSYVYAGAASGIPSPGDDVQEVKALSLNELDHWLARSPRDFVPSFEEELRHARAALQAMT
jgi:isopentenyl-diphosphate delta-isomerase